MFPFLLLVSPFRHAMGMLNSLNKFSFPQWPQLFYLGSILSGPSLCVLLFTFNREPIIGMAIGTLVGGLLQIAIQLPELRNQGFAFSWRLDLRDEGLRRINEADAARGHRPFRHAD